MSTYIGWRSTVLLVFTAFMFGVASGIWMNGACKALPGDVAKAQQLLNRLENAAQQTRPAK